MEGKQIGQPLDVASTVKRFADRFGRMGIYGGIVVLLIIAAIAQPSLVGPAQLVTIAKLSAVLGIAALGQTFVTVSRGFDISQGGVITLTVVLANTLMNGEAGNIFLGVTVCLLVSVIVGLINGLVVGVLKVPSIIASLGTFAVTTGGSVIYSGGVPTGSIPQAFLFLGRGYLGPMPVSVIVWLILTVVAGVILQRTVIGRSMFARGANETAAFQAGLNVLFYGALPYVLSSIAACIAGLVYASYIGLPVLSAGTQYSLSTIAAAVVGGTSLAGGKGTMVGTSAGAFFLTMLSALIISFSLPEGVRMIVTGIIIIAAIYLSRRDEA